MKPYKTFLAEMKMDDVVFKKKIDGGYFVATKRDTSGMSGSQDKFKMAIVDDKGKLITDLGTHPSRKGLEKFADKVTSVDFDPFK